MVFYKKEDDHQSASLVLSSENKNKLEFEVDCLDNISNEANTKHVDFMIIQLNGVKYEALEGLNIVKPKNLSIAARYDSGTEKTSRKILNLLENRGYFVKLVEEEYVFAELKMKRV
ncbi:MAG: hypothetical protein U5K00_07295 [Melioribacteraceae bacterium]|nr:hypothetical protein [Melioribacteraceae bacterium]